MKRIRSGLPKPTIPAVRLPFEGLPGREPLLFTPGPLTCSHAVKQAMLVDLGSRDTLFTSAIVEVREGILEMAGVSQKDGYECIIVQGSGTFGVESVIGSVIPKKDGKLLVLSNGAYGERMTTIAKYYNIPVEKISWNEVSVPNPEQSAAAVAADPSITHVGFIHHETTSGALSDVAEITKAVKTVNPKITVILDSMSAFGCYPINLKEVDVDYLVSSANKCIEGVPGFSFVIAKRSNLISTEGNARSLSLDLLEQWKKLEETGQFRFTPPTHAILAFRQAIREHKAEGGVQGRLARYTNNFNILKEGMAQMGFHPYLEPDVQGCIITTFLFPEDPNFKFQTFYKALQDRGMVIYPGKLTKADCFRLGTIGRLFERDIVNLLTAIRQVLTEMGVQLPVKQIPSPEIPQ